MIFPSPNFGDRREGAIPSLIVLHYTAMDSCAAARTRLCDPAAEVSAHWLISETGEVEQLVDEACRAWHAGAGEWAGLSDINSHSIGIELANRGDHPFPEPQMQALEGLLPRIMARWSIPAHRVIGHSDMAPERKSDPGPRFDWARLARQGLAVWPTSGVTEVVDPARFRDFARAAGYASGLDDTMLLRAIRLHFRPWAEGPLDGRDMQIAVALAALAVDEAKGRS